MKYAVEFKGETLTDSLESVEKAQIWIDKYFDEESYQNGNEPGDQEEYEIVGYNEDGDDVSRVKYTACYDGPGYYDEAKEHGTLWSSCL
jgi:hypothetical protein